MKYNLIAFLILLAIAIIAFVIWFIMYRKSGKCPLCALEKIKAPTKVTMDISETENYNNGVALTPPMGWSSWNTFRQNISEDLILEVADAMKKSGLVDAGYQYLNLDDCWQSSIRDNEGRFQGDLEKFPNGISSLVSKINLEGIKVGIYSSNGTLTCEDLPASLGNEKLDAYTFASWGCEYVKYDFCHHKRISGEAPVIEALDISLPGSKSEITLLPEDAELSGRAQVINVKRLPSGKGIGLLNHGAGSATFNPVVNFDGIYVLTIRYFKEPTLHNKYLQIIVNGEIYEVTFPSSKGFTPTARAQVMIKMRGGSNEIVIKNPVKTFADSEYIQYSRMGNALKQASKLVAFEKGTIEKPIVYSICEWGTAFPWHWGAKAGNLWRTTHDIFPNWNSIKLIYRRNVGLYKHSAPGAWNDPDMLEVGNGKLTEDENKAHFSLWCMMAAPLILGNDIRKFVDSEGNAIDSPILKILTNKSMILIDQDPLGKAAKIIKKEKGFDILARPLANGDVALCLFNKTSKDKGITFDLTDLAKEEYLTFTEQNSYQINDIWSEERYAGKNVSVSVPKHGCKVFRVSLQ